MRALTPDAWAAVHDAPHPTVARIVRWAPIVTPAVVGSLLLTLALLLVARAGYPPYAPLTPSLVIPALLLTYLVWGALQGLALYFAPNGVVWSLAFFGMPPLLLVALFSVAFGWPGGLFTLAALAAAWLLYSGGRRSQTPAGAVEVALLFGEWYRTLPHGYNVLLPGERVIVALRVTPRSFTTALQQVSLGPDRIAQARATVAYVVQARDAWRTASVRATWEAELRQRISASVRESLGEWRVTPEGDLAAHGSIAQRALDDTRAWARSVGVRILSVRAHDIAVGSPRRLASASQPAPASSTAPASAQSAQSAAPSVRPTPRIARTGAPAWAPTPAGASVAQPDIEPDSEPDAGPAVARALPLMRTPASLSAEPPSPAALEDLYEAVRNRKITDSQVIREIASHFVALASSPPSVTATLPFDPAAAARLLEEYAAALDAAQGVRRPARRVARSY
ncbi:MAG TPA: hypothetical protein VFU60_11315 [Ktedonobacterales bacterium]|nr:hypothetical protein [Ktedonobacterales bacterium]